MTSTDSVQRLLDLDELCVIETGKMTSPMMNDVDSTASINMSPTSVDQQFGILPTDIGFYDVTDGVTSRSTAVGISCIVTSSDVAATSGVQRASVAYMRQTK